LTGCTPGPAPQAVNLTMRGADRETPALVDALLRGRSR